MFATEWQTVVSVQFIFVHLQDEERKDLLHKNRMNSTTIQQLENATIETEGKLAQALQVCQFALQVYCKLLIKNVLFGG